MAIDFTGAQSYFAGANHPKASVWAAFSQQQRQGAVEGAKRILSRELGRALREDEPPYEYGDRKREEFAAYEQALYMLEIGAVADGATDAPIAVLTGRGDTADAGQEAASRYAPHLSAAALRWLGTVMGAAVLRG